MNELQEERLYTELLEEARTTDLDKPTLISFEKTTAILEQQGSITREQRFYIWEIILDRDLIRAADKVIEEIERRNET